MKTSLRSVVIFASIFFLPTCKEKSALSVQIEKLMNSQLTIPQEMKDQFAHDSADMRWRNTVTGLTILTVINGNCGYCVESLAKWKELMKEPEFSANNIKYYFLVESEDEFISFNNINEQNDLIDYPLIIDRDGLFFKSMNISPNATLQTFLLDDQSKIVMIGNPTHDLSIKEMYKTEIKKRFPLQ